MRRGRARSRRRPLGAFGAARGRRGLEVLVLDEADRMLDIGFLPDIRRILRHVHARRKTLLFSATLPAGIVGLAGEILRDPASVDMTPTTAKAPRGHRRAPAHRRRTPTNAHRR